MNYLQNYLLPLAEKSYWNFVYNTILVGLSSLVNQSYNYVAKKYPFLPHIEGGRSPMLQFSFLIFEKNTVAPTKWFCSL